MAAALAAMMVSMGAMPAMAQDPAMPPPAAQELVAPAANSGGVQNWRYSEFISAVEKDKVEKVLVLIRNYFMWISYSAQLLCFRSASTSCK